MINRIFLDTNIILDMVDSKRDNHQNSIKLLEILVFNNIEVFISEDMISTIFFVIKDKNYILDFIENVLFKWNIVPFGKNVLSCSIKFAKENSCDLEDALQCFCAKENRCSAILTNDKCFVDCGIDIINYKEFFEKF